MLKRNKMLSISAVASGDFLKKSRRSNYLKPIRRLVSFFLEKNLQIKLVTILNREMSLISAKIFMLLGIKLNMYIKTNFYPPLWVLSVWRDGSAAGISDNI